ncbi:ferritin-like domain-containing protein [Mesorhizobium sp. 1B3]|uniref:ferritin-like domain-containing protein n=1 Tax=Mesorhizobium sp. 1B3 TaxID=3243599 RepID=UPI003D986415
MTTAGERLDQWLRDAHAMEEQAEQMLSALAGRIENYPKLKARIEEHLEETRRQAQRVRSCIERRGASTSTLKDAAGKIMATMQGVSGVFAGDEIVKGTLAGYTFEHMEIMSYRVLAQAAKAAGDEETARVCTEIMDEEQAMADWLFENSADVISQYLIREEQDSEQAKR